MMACARGGGSRARCVLVGLSASVVGVAIAIAADPRPLELPARGEPHVVIGRVTPPPGARLTVTPIEEPCDADALLARSADRVHAGDPRGAVALVIRAIACRPEVRAYRLVVLYACEARDAATAQQYFALLPSQFQGAAAEKCELHDVALAR
jgi:hypothetical protein